MATFQNDAVPKYREQDIPRTVKELRNYTFNLSEQMMFLFSNLDEDNVPELSEIKKRLTDAEGNITKITIDAKGLAIQVEDNEKNIASLQLTAQGLLTRITDAEGNISTLEQTASGLTSRVASAEGDISTLKQTATSLESQIGNANAEISKIDQRVDSITLTVSNSESYSTIKLSVDGIAVQSERIHFTGDIIFASNLTDKTTIISGSNILTGKIAAKYLDVAEAIDNHMADGVGEINFIYRDTKVGYIQAVQSDLMEIWAIDFLNIGCPGDIQIDSSSAISMNSDTDIDISSRNGDINLDCDMMRLTPTTKLYVNTDEIQFRVAGSSWYLDDTGWHQ